MPPECSSVVGDRWHQPRRAGRPRAIRATDGGQSDVDGPQPGRGQQGDVRQHASRQQIGKLDPAAGASRSPSLVHGRARSRPYICLDQSMAPGRTAACHHSAEPVTCTTRRANRVHGRVTGFGPAPRYGGQVAVVRRPRARSSMFIHFGGSAPELSVARRAPYTRPAMVQRVVAATRFVLIVPAFIAACLGAAIAWLWRPPLMTVAEAGSRAGSSAPLSGRGRVDVSG